MTRPRRVTCPDCKAQMAHQAKTVSSLTKREVFRCAFCLRTITYDYVRRSLHEGWRLAKVDGEEVS